MEITYLTEKNYKLFFDENKDKMELMPLIRDWIEEKKKTLPSWDQYGYCENNNIYHRFMLDESPEWKIVEKDLRYLGDYRHISKQKVAPTNKEIKEAAKEAWASREE